LRLTFSNIENELENFIHIDNQIIDISQYDFIEPLGCAILKALKEDNPDIEIMGNPNNPSFSYITTLANSKYNPQKTYIPIEIVNIGNENESRNKIVEAILKSFKKSEKDLSKEDLNDLKQYLEYMIGELLNNAILHSLSQIGAVITGQYFPYIKKLQICIVDRGVGFLQNLKKRYSVKTEEEAIKKALEKGVTSPPFKSNAYYSQISHAGFGLYALKTIIEKTMGNLLIISNSGVVKLTPEGLKSQTINTTWEGSIVIFEFFEQNINHSLEEFMRIYLWGEEEENEEIF